MGIQQELPTALFVVINLAFNFLQDSHLSWHLYKYYILNRMKTMEIIW